MGVLFVILVIWITIFMFASYQAIVNGSNCGMWVTGICLWMMFVCLLGITMFG